MDHRLEPPKPMAPIAAASPTATRWVIDALAPLREYLTPWPAVLPSDVGDPIRLFKIGVHEDLAARLPDGEAREVLETIREHGPDNVAVILQGRMVRSGEIVDAGISALPKPPKG